MHTELVMKSIRNLVLSYFLAAGTALAAGPTLITFDDLPPAGIRLLEVPNGYAGLQWDNFYYVNPLLRGFQPSGYYNGMVSAPQVAFNWYANPAIFSGESFNLLSA